jgi:hypothetical protein
MKIKKYIYLSLTILFFNCQQAEKRAFNNEMFGWKVSFPENFYDINKDKWTELKSNGEKLIVNDSNLNITDQSKTIFVIENGEFNRFESNYTLKKNFIEPNSTFEQSMKKINIVLYDSFKDKVPDAKIDSLTTFEKIDNLEFMKFEINTQFEDGLTIKSKSYKRLFYDKVLSINIIYMNEYEGNKIMESFINSKFEKN